MRSGTRGEYSRKAGKGARHVSSNFRRFTTTYAPSLSLPLPPPRLAFSAPVLTWYARNLISRSEDMNSCYGPTPNPKNYTTFHARTYLQPQLNKAIKYSEKDVKGDKNPKDFIVFWDKDYLVRFCHDLQPPLPPRLHPHPRPRCGRPRRTTLGRVCTRKAWCFQPSRFRRITVSRGPRSRSNRQWTLASPLACATEARVGEGAWADSVTVAMWRRGGLRSRAGV